jgi:pyrroline-5-carboxylate reductase
VVYLEIFTQNITILGSGNIGSSIAKGFILSSMIKPEQIILTRRKTKLLTPFEKKGCIITDNNCEAVKKSDIIIIAVPPQQIKELLQQINSDLNPKKHIIISVVSGVTTEEILRLIKKQIQVVRAMPNIASAIRESMTCIASDTASSQTIEQAKKLFDYVGKTFIISEEQMVPATALGACGIAFFLRAIRAASQGGIEIGFHSYEAIPMAAQTAKGAAALVLNMDNHPEMEIDKVTTPEGCTIAGLNEMEHQGFSSAMIKGITTSAEKATKLYKNNKE